MKIQLALEPQVTRGDVEAFAERSCWRRVLTFQAEAQHGFEIQWEVPDRAVDFAYIENDVVGQAWLALGGPDAETDNECVLVRAALRCRDLEQVLQCMSRSDSPDEQVVLAGMLAVLAPDAYDGNVMHALADMLQSASVDVRMKALLATANIGWPLLQPLVTAVADSDEHPAVRQRAKEVRLAFEAVQRRRRGTP